MITRRASSDNLFMKCPGAAYPAEDEILVNPVDDAGIVGTCVHMLLEDHLCNRLGEFDHYQSAYGLNDAQMKEVEIMVAIGARWVREYTEGWELLMSELLMSEQRDEIEYTGHADIIYASDDTLIVVDWKTTRLEDADYHNQMMRYLWLAGQIYPDQEKFQSIVVFLRDKTETRSMIYSRNDLEDYHDSYIEKVEGWDQKTYNPGGHCHYCPRALTCPARLAELQFIGQSIGPFDEPRDLDGVNDATLVELYQKVKSYEKFSKSATEAIRLRVEHSGDRLGGDEKDLVLKETCRTVIDVKAAWEVLQSTMDDTQLAKCLSISKTKMLDAAAENAPHGKKKLFKEQLMESLDAAGALAINTFKKFALVASDKKVTTKVLEGTTNE